MIMKQYYIANIIWQSKFNVDKVKKFDNIKYDDKIILYYDFPYSYYKIMLKQKQDKMLFIAAINCCLRMYEKIKQIYPYNSVYICIYTNDKTLIDYEAFKSVIDLIPDFAIITDDNKEDLSYFTGLEYKHIFYGRCSGVKSVIKENYQCWSIINGNLIVK